jgi:hypothetical protein
MTRKDLEKMGIYHLGYTVYPNKFFVPLVGEVNLYEPYNYEYIFTTIYESGFYHGEENGKTKTINEICPT